MTDIQLLLTTYLAILENGLTIGYKYVQIRTELKQVGFNIKHTPILLFTNIFVYYYLLFCFVATRNISVELNNVYLFSQMFFRIISRRVLNN